MPADTKSTEELAEAIAIWVPKFLIARERYATALTEWGSYVYKMEVLAGEHIHAGDEFKEEHDIEWAKLDKNMSHDELQALFDKLKEIDGKVKAAKAQVDKKMVALRKDYVTTLLPLYKECNETFAHVDPSLTDLIKLVDVYGSIHHTDRPLWWDSLLEQALRYEKDGRLEEEMEKPMYPERT